MTNTKTTKRALFASVLSLLLCVSMLIGSTFAWFTDTATTGVNKIQAGTLDIALVDKDGNSLEGETLNFIKADGTTQILWEPGCTYSLPEVFVKNNGNLALKYTIAISGINGDAKLNEAIEWTVQLAGADLASEYKLAPCATSEALTISGHMKEEAGNEYQGLTIDGIAITVYATQDTVEYDSNSNQYDKDATLPVVVYNQAELDDAIANATKATTVIVNKGTYILNGIKNKNLTFVGDKNTVFDVTAAVGANDSTLAFQGVTLKYDNGTYEGFQHSKKVSFEDCAFTGTQFLYATEGTEFVNCTFDMYDAATEYSVWTYGTSATFIDCVFDTHGKAILVYDEKLSGTSNIVVDGCTFISDGTVDTEKAAVETGIVSGSENVYNITVKDSIVAGFGVSPKGAVTSSTVWSNKNSMAAGKLNVTVSNVKELKVAETESELNSAVSADGAEIFLADGEYAMPDLQKINPNSTVAIYGTEDAVIDIEKKIAYADGCTITFDGVTIEHGEGNYYGIAHASKIVYKDCVIKGRNTLYATDVEFINCTLENLAGYNIWTWGAANVTFTDCDFVSGGKSVLVYNGSTTGSFVANVTMTNCTFSDSGAFDGKAAVETGSDGGNTATSNKYNLTFSNCTVDGFEAVNSTSALWGNKNSMDADHLNVVIDGVDVY